MAGQLPPTTVPMSMSQDLQNQTQSLLQQVLAVDLAMGFENHTNGAAPQRVVAGQPESSAPLMSTTHTVNFAARPPAPAASTMFGNAGPTPQPSVLPPDLASLDGVGLPFPLVPTGLLASAIDDPMFAQEKNQRDNKRRREQSASACKRYRDRQREEKARLTTEVETLRERVKELEMERSASATLLAKLENCISTAFLSDEMLAEHNRLDEARRQSRMMLFGDIMMHKTRVQQALESYENASTEEAKRACGVTLSTVLNDSKNKCFHLQMLTTPREFLESMGYKDTSNVDIDSMNCLVWDKPEGLSVLESLNMKAAQVRGVLEKREDALKQLEPIYKERKEIQARSEKNIKQISAESVAEINSNEVLETSLTHSADLLQSLQANIMREMKLRMQMSFETFCGCDPVKGCNAAGEDLADPSAFSEVMKAKLFIYGFPQNMRGIEFATGVMKYYASKAE